MWIANGVLHITCRHCAVVFVCVCGRVSSLCLRWCVQEDIVTMCKSGIQRNSEGSYTRDCVSLCLLSPVSFVSVSCMYVCVLLLLLFCRSFFALRPAHLFSCIPQAKDMLKMAEAELGPSSHSFVLPFETPPSSPENGPLSPSLSSLPSISLPPRSSGRTSPSSSSRYPLREHPSQQRDSEAGTYDAFHVLVLSFCLMLLFFVTLSL